MRSFALLLLAINIVSISLAQTLSFTPLQATTFNIGRKDVTVDIPFTIGGLNFASVAEVEFLEPVSNPSKTPGQHYSYLTPLSLLVQGSQPAGTVKIKFVAQPIGTASTLFTVQARTRLAGTSIWSPTVLSQVFTINYSNSVFPTTTYQTYFNQIGIIDNRYHCGPGAAPAGMGPRKKAVQDIVLDSNLSIVFSNVALGSNDLIKTGTAGSITQDKDKGTLSFNATFLRKHKNSTGGINVGINAKTSGGFYNIFSKDGWSKEFGINGGYTLIPHTASQFFFPNDCQALRRKRDTFYSRLLVDYAAILSDDLNQLFADSQANEVRMRRSLLYNTPLSKSEYNSLDSERRSLTVRLRNLRRLLAPFPTRPGMVDLDAVEAILVKEIAAFDQTNDVLSGYKFWYYDIKPGIAHNSISLNTDNLPEDTKKQFTSKGILKLSMQASANYTRLTNYTPNTNGTLYFFQTNLAFDRGSLLDVPGMVGKPSLKQMDGTANYAIINTDNSDTIGLTSELDIPVCTITPGIYTAAFFTKGQQLGWDIRMNFRFLIDPYPGHHLVNTYNVLTGPVFRIATEKDFSKATIGIKIGFSNAPVKTDRLWKDYLTIRAEIGVPFKWYYKETVSK